MSRLRVTRAAYDDPVVQAMVVEVQAEYADRYGGQGDTAPIDAGEFDPPHGSFLVGWLGADAVAMGGVRSSGEGTAEIKRMYVRPVWRGRGLSRQMLAALEDAARALGATFVRLETGLRQPEAIRLYETSGYQPVVGFGFYRDSPLSRCFGKQLGGDPTSAAEQSPGEAEDPALQ
jgi:GNAT superfamily N-acetyltransferase